jgi:Family of unknown function (DUF6314)
MKPPPISPRLLSYLFTSLSSYSPAHASAAAPLLSSAQTRKWHLRRLLRSDNPAEINGELTGTATFHPLHHNNNANNDRKHKHREIVYREEGEMPSSVPGMAGLRWTKKYIWRLNNDADSNENNNDVNSPEDAKETDENLESSAGAISVWFAKIRPRNEEQEEEADYLFHEFDFGLQQGDDAKACSNTNTNEKTELLSLQPPMPPPLPALSTLAQTYPETKVIEAKGDHLCVKDMYYTAYSFRIVPETGEVLSWASRHVVKGPKKNQDIVNLYSIAG